MVQLKQVLQCTDDGSFALSNQGPYSQRHRLTYFMVDNCCWTWILRNLDVDRPKANSDIDKTLLTRADMITSGLGMMQFLLLGGSRFNSHPVLLVVSRKRFFQLCLFEMQLNGYRNVATEPVRCDIELQKVYNVSQPTASHNSHNMGREVQRKP